MHLNYFLGRPVSLSLSLSIAYREEELRFHLLFFFVQVLLTCLEGVERGSSSIHCTRLDSFIFFIVIISRSARAHWAKWAHPKDR